MEDSSTKFLKSNYAIKSSKPTGNVALKSSKQPSDIRQYLRAPPRVAGLPSSASFPLEKLPLPTIKIILQFLPNFAVFGALQVCKSWNWVISLGVHSLHLKITSNNRQNMPNFEKFENITNLSLKGFDDLSEPHKKALAKLHRVTSITLLPLASQGAVSSPVAPFLKQYSSLLSLNGKISSNFASIGGYCPALQSLCLELTDFHLNCELFASLPQLNNLQIEGRKNVNISKISSIGSCTQMKTLSLRFPHQPISNENLVPLFSLGELVSLGLVFLIESEISSEGLEQLTRLTRLEINCNLKSFLFVQKLTKLKELSIGAPNIDLFSHPLILPNLITADFAHKDKKGLSPWGTFFQLTSEPPNFVRCKPFNCPKLHQLTLTNLSLPPLRILSQLASLSHLIINSPTIHLFQERLPQLSKLLSLKTLTLGLPPSLPSIIHLCEPHFVVLIPTVLQPLHL